MLLPLQGDHDPRATPQTRRAPRAAPRSPSRQEELNVRKLSCAVTGGGGSRVRRGARLEGVGRFLVCARARVMCYWPSTSGARRAALRVGARACEGDYV